MTMKTIKEPKQTLWNNKNFQRMMDVVRMLLLIIAVVILITLLMNIQEVKILSGDVCKLCMEKTGATCFSTKVTP